MSKECCKMGNLNYGLYKVAAYAAQPKNNQKTMWINL